jgi:large subunit ribosomal protein L32
MGVPKHRKSIKQRRQNQTHLKAVRVTISECTRCHEPKLPHHVCMECGYYKGMEIIAMNEDDE